MKKRCSICLLVLCYLYSCEERTSVVTNKSIFLSILRSTLYMPTIYFTWLYIWLYRQTWLQNNIVRLIRILNDFRLADVWMKLCDILVSINMIAASLAPPTCISSVSVTCVVVSQCRLLVARYFFVVSVITVTKKIVLEI